VTVAGGAGEELADVFALRQISDEETVHQGMIWDVVRDTVELGAGTVRREYVRHPGAVTVLALDDSDRVLFLRQYRHPVRMELWELPAGLLDVVGEPPLLAAKRELAEEADLEAGRWDVLLDWFNSPGGSDEALRCYLARDVTPAATVFDRQDEELDMPRLWVPLEEARDAVLAGRVHNPGAALGVLAAVAARDLGWSTLRPGDAEWPEHPSHRTGG
jgi:ADP-ribose pyrophosphatase